MKDAFDLTGKVAVVTGGLGLIGRGLVAGLAEAGAHVFMADIDEAGAQEVARDMREQGWQVSSVALDIRDEASIARCMDSVAATGGALDVLVNSAYPKTPGAAVEIESVPEDVWRTEVDAHLNGYSFCCRDAARLMREQGGGSIVNIGSTYGIVAPDFSIYDGLPGMTTPATYAAIKGGIITLTRYLASYYGSAAIRVNCVSPGGIANNQNPVFVQRYEAKTPLGRMGTPRDIAGAVVFLASDAAAYVTGHNLVVDGGWTAV